MSSENEEDQPTKAVDYILTRDGGIYQLMPSQINYDELRARLAEITPEEAMAAANRYIHARYDAAMQDSLIELFAVAYPEPEEPE